ncbi:hypothetical protein ES703_92179 [subsurface metagenome]
MVGEWLRTILEDHVAVGDAVTSITVPLPTSNFIGGLDIRLSGTGGSGTVVLDDIITKVEVIANGSAVIKSLSGGDLRRIATFDTGVVPEITEDSDGTADGITVPVSFGRYVRDLLCMLPAKIFKTLQLKITTGTLIATTVFATGTVKLDVVCEEYVSNDDPLSKLILKDTEVESHTSAAQTKDIELPLGNRYRRAMVFCTEGQTDLELIQVRINNGAVIPLTTRYDISLFEDTLEYKLNAAFTDVTMVDFDKRGDLSGCLVSSRFNDLKLRYTEQAGSTIRTVTQEVVSIRGS